MDNLTQEQRHKNMQHIKSKDSKIELTLRKALRKKGIRYRKNWKDLPGKPDIVITKYKIAIFCDSEFFHGKDWESDLRKRLENSSNPDYWVPKIKRNIERDRELSIQLNGMGWTVLRFWGKDILKYTDECVQTIEEIINEIKFEVLDFDDDDL